ncbi:hypothetical protein H1V43_32035 [Streptomyces sp. PSKA54]|uniref:Uncharacterized protein n=1 Tax=Streptomyces himalayensis subsp. aureolus TaxID=2758039 RepID=A0A7W2D6X8_9ACTN|nr:hypothetical protein [Streptomyces himalayensis]MBA4865895.1 hypothetical protein [Streptomyces himalayensis subsp. aureolus]
MTTIDETAPATDAGELLRQWATSPRDAAAVAALLEEADLLARDDVRRVLLDETDDGGMACDWSQLARSLYALDLTEAELAFLGFVLSIAYPSQVALSRVRDLDERRLAVLLRALVTLSGIGTIAVGTRIS